MENVIKTPLATITKENEQVQVLNKQIMQDTTNVLTQKIQLSKRITSIHKKLTIKRMMVDAIGDTIEFIYGWKVKWVINGVISKTNELIKDNFKECIDD